MTDFKRVRNVFISLVLSVTTLIGIGNSKKIKAVADAATPNIPVTDTDKFMLFNDKVKTLPVGPEGINVLIKDSFTPEQKECIIDAIHELDIQLDNIKYNIYLDHQKAPNKCITIEEVDFTVTRGGLTMLTYLPFNPYLMYPIEIYIDTDWHKTENQLKCVIKHELLHTLGLKDLYDQKYETESIMYFAQTPDSPKDLTQKDKDLVNSVYTHEYVNCGLFANTKVGNAVVASATKKKNTEDEMTL